MTPARPLRRLSALGVFLLFVLSGCYGYVPVERPSPGTSVRVQIPVRSAVEGSSRAPETVTMEGRVVSFTDTLRLEMRNDQRVGARSFVAVDTVRVATGSLIGVEERVFSKGRTAVFTAALVGGVALATWGIASLTGGDESGKPDNGPVADPPGIFTGFRQGLRVFGISVPFP